MPEQESQYVPPEESAGNDELKKAVDSEAEKKEGGHESELLESLQEAVMYTYRAQKYRAIPREGIRGKLTTGFGSIAFSLGKAERYGDEIKEIVLKSNIDDVTVIRDYILKANETDLPGYASYISHRPYSVFQHRSLLQPKEDLRQDVYFNALGRFLVKYYSLAGAKQYERVSEIYKKMGEEDEAQRYWSLYEQWEEKQEREYNPKTHREDLNRQHKEWSHNLFAHKQDIVDAMDEFISATKDGPYMALDVDKGLEELKMKLEKDIADMQSR